MGRFFFNLLKGLDLMNKFVTLINDKTRLPDKAKLWKIGINKKILEKIHHLTHYTIVR